MLILKHLFGIKKKLNNFKKTKTYEENEFSNSIPDANFKSK